MQPDKLFHVTLVSLVSEGYESILGIVKAESLPEALQYIGREYPNYSVQSIEETSRILL